MESTPTPTRSRSLPRPGRVRSRRRLAAAAVVVTLGLTACIVTTRRPDGIPLDADNGTLRATAFLEAPVWAPADAVDGDAPPRARP